MPARKHKPHDISPEVSRLRARVGALAIVGAPPEEIAQARAELAEALLEARIEKLIAAAPPLSPEKKARLAALLDPAGGTS